MGLAIFSSASPSVVLLVHGMEDAARQEKRRQPDRLGTRQRCFLIVLLLIGMRVLQTMLSEPVLVLRGVTSAKPMAEAGPKPLGAGVLAALHLLRNSQNKRADMFHEWPELMHRPPRAPRTGSRPAPWHARAACDEDNHHSFIFTRTPDDTLAQQD